MAKRLLGLVVATWGAAVFFFGLVLAAAVISDSSDAWGAAAFLLGGGVAFLAKGVSLVKSAPSLPEAQEPGLIERYTVVYRGGHPDYPTTKHSAIAFLIFGDRFELRPGVGSNWFAGLTLPFNSVSDLQIVERTLGTFEGIAGGLDSRQLNQRNNLHITYTDASRRELVLRLEMLTGITVMGNELVDRLRTHQIRERFARPSDTRPRLKGDILPQIEQLGSLRDRGLLSHEEFETTKAELLSQL